MKMKKIVWYALGLLVLASCNGASKREQALTMERDSLLQIISEKDTELNDVMGIVADVQEGFRRINDAQGRITLADGDIESVSSKRIIIENMQYIQEVMAQNREMITQLKTQLKNSNIQGEKMKRLVDDLTSQLEQQRERIQVLEAELIDKNILIASMSDSINVLSGNLDILEEENRKKTKTLQEQDRQLHAAWYVFGTKAELKEQNILKSGDVLKTADFNKEYFTQLDTRYDKEIKLYSASAKLLTTHPDGSYKLLKDKKNQYVLSITNPEKFWSVSNYLVVQVK